MKNKKWNKLVYHADADNIYRRKKKHQRKVYVKMFIELNYPYNCCICTSIRMYFISNLTCISCLCKKKNARRNS